MFHVIDFMKKGGKWLGAARDWMQRKKHNGSTVTWGSGEVLSPPVTVRELEEAAAYAVAAELAESLSTMLGELRAAGWMVAVHNDYRQNGVVYTFWLFTHEGGTWLKGEGRTDEEAVRKVRAQAAEKALQGGVKCSE